jgi:hypothetical protein
MAEIRIISVIHAVFHNQQFLVFGKLTIATHIWCMFCTPRSILSPDGRFLSATATWKPPRKKESLARPKSIFGAGASRAWESLAFGLLHVTAIPNIQKRLVDFDGFLGGPRNTQQQHQNGTPAGILSTRVFSDESIPNVRATIQRATNAMR